ncbi:DNA polymerase III subunit gamma/tau, partial [Patescibacteria group bacterium]|nr:DNA polymerase III subunit gamma/tau [Patescibacteria group bacterium]
MPDLTLYRRYRPQTFEEVVGQEHLIPALQKSVAEGTFAHAYLFAGSRGTGKTSVARILARELGTDERDLYEIDAASNRGIDDIRALREEIQNLPFSSPYKVYILDEVHMLSKDAFNALLKTLEEPPAHAVFILATTELHKVPETIRSRCQLLSFTTPTEATLAHHTLAIAAKEGYTLTPQSAELIALMGEGSYRDTLGALQKVLGMADTQTVTHETVEAALGAPKLASINALITALAEHDGNAALSALHELSRAGV